MKVDVAIQSYKKPELLLYTLLSLKKVSESMIDEIWIQDDSFDTDVLNFYTSDKFIEALKPWKINLRANTQRGGWWFTPVSGLYPNYLTLVKRFIFSLRSKYRGTGFSLLRENSRYQWGISNSKKNFLMIIHDDIVFHKDIVKDVLERFEANDNLAIIGDLGQCWRCEYNKLGCSPDKIMMGYRPSKSWPDIDIHSSGHRWPCRINEWCCFVSLPKVKIIEEKYQVLFGGYDNHGDVAAYWFNLVIKENYDFEDISTIEKKKELFLHADGGSGHSVWVDQGNGKSKYDPEHVKRKILEDFKIDLR